MSRKLGPYHGARDQSLSSPSFQGQEREHFGVLDGCIDSRGNPGAFAQEAETVQSH